MSTIFTLRQEHLDLLASGGAYSIRAGHVVLGMPKTAEVQRILGITLDNESAKRDARAVLGERDPALNIILQSRGAAVPLGRYERKEGRWSLVEEME